MKLEELNERLKDLRNKYDSDVLHFKREYCDRNNPYKVGDIFTDHIGSIIIESIKYYPIDKPCCVYYGIELKKDGTPRKDSSKRQAWQSNEKK